MKRKERVERGERDRFARNLAVMGAGGVGVTGAGGGLR